MVGRDGEEKRSTSLRNVPAGDRRNPSSMNHCLNWFHLWSTLIHLCVDHELDFIQNVAPESSRVQSKSGLSEQRPELVGGEKMKKKKRRQTEEDKQVGGAAGANKECYYCVITMCVSQRVDLI